MQTEVLRLRGKNFQAWEDFDLTIGGLTVIVGPTDIGKSALYRSIKGLLRNEVSAGQIRLGEPAVDLELTLGDHTISTKRTRKGAVTYTVDGMEYAKLSGAVPPPVEEMGFGEIEIGGVSIDPMFSLQSDHQFLIDSSQSPQSLNAILGGFSSTEKLDQGKKAANLRILQLNQEAKTLALNIQADEEFLSKMIPLRVAADAIREELQAVHTQYQRTDLITKQLSRLVASRKAHLTLINALRALDIPDMTIPEDSLKVIQATDRVRRSLQQHASLSQILSAFPVVDGFEGEATWSRIVHAREVQRARKSGAKYSASAAKLTGVEEKFNDAVLQYRILHAIRTLQSVSQGSGKRNITEGLTSLNQILTFAEEKIPEAQRILSRLAVQAQLALAFTQHQKLVSSRITAETHLETAENGLARIQSEQETAAREGDLCPHCGKTIPHHHGGSK